jgi:hypothetical protein
MIRLLMVALVPAAVAGVVLLAWPRREAGYTDEHMADWRDAA